MVGSGGRRGRRLSLTRTPALFPLFRRRFLGRDCKSTEGIRRKSVPWWNENCKKAFRNKVFRQLKKHHSLEILIQYKRAQAVVRKNIRTAKRVYWKNYCNTIGRETQLSDIWGMIKRMTGIKRKYEIPILNQNGKMAISDIEKVEMLAQMLVKIKSSENLSNAVKQERINTMTENRNITDKRNVIENDIDLPFNMSELKKAVLNVKKTYPGKDNIWYTMLAHMEDVCLM